jgi:hypothetical protein
MMRNVKLFVVAEFAFGCRATLAKLSSEKTYFIEDK